jgi:hypothetical protein
VCPSELSQFKGSVHFQRYQIVAPADKLEATRKLEASQQQERELLKSQAITFGQGSGRLHEKRGEVAKAASPPLRQPFSLTDCEKMGLN